MLLKNVILIFITFLMGLSVHADIQNVTTMNEALAGVDSDTLVIFDLDNTVMMPPQSLGGEEWYDYFVEKRTRENISKGMPVSQAKDQAINQGLLEWNQFHSKAKVVPVETETPNLISEIQKKGTKTMALTARPLELADATVAQLKSIGIDFSKNSVSSKIIQVPGKNISQFKNGALLVGPKNNKGEVLVKFLKQLKLNPKKIYFIDNKLHHVENVGKALEPTKVSYFGRRHSAADHKIESMDKEVVEIQHRYFFGDVLTNKQAEILKRANL